ncbi:MAG: hypothetical protein M3419_03830 [Actinomycetota bacterium]|nr:hypothetical protein [Actinomycetota bacterium]
MLDIDIRSHTMYSMSEELARAHVRERLRQASEARQAYHLAAARRLTRRAERANGAATLHLARVSSA